jgi:glycosyltransferase involved in cell wall biosynthesis
MLKKPFVSVIIPVYNGEKTLEKCLNSVLNQDYPHYEVIIVDNNSNDKTKEIIIKVESKKVKYLFEKRIGRGAARNLGERKAKGNIILMTDSDCIVPNNWIKEMIKPIIIGNFSCVQGFEDNVKNNFWNRQYQLRSYKRFNQNFLFDEQLIGHIDTKNFAIKKNILKKIGFTSEKYISGNDLELSIKIAKEGISTKFLGNIKVKHFHPEFKKFSKKQIYRAWWHAKITNDNIDYLRKTSFLKKTCQTPYSFLTIFPGLIKTLIKEGPSYAFYDFIEGSFWRVGIIKFYLFKWFHNPII